MAGAGTQLQSPFKFLDPYGREDAAIFFGREEEVENLYQSVCKNRLVLVYGQSGTGKTSLVQCGLANRFEVTDWAPFFIRRGKNINESLRQALSQSKALGSTELGYGPGPLLNAVDRISARYLRPVFLIFDQFEELLILGEEEEKAAFTATISQLLTSDEGRSCSFIFVLREEYFAWLEPFERRIPGFSGRRLRVEPMRPAKVREVVIHSCRFFNVTLENEDENARQIVDSLSGKAGISLPYLQVYLDMLWRVGYARTYPDGWKGEGYPSLGITTAELGRFGAIQDVLDRFLSERREAIQSELQEVYHDVGQDAVRRVLDAFVTDEGTKRPVNYSLREGIVHLDETAPEFLRQLPPPLLTSCLEELEKSRLLRSDTDTFELAHDSLAALIDRQRTDEQRRLNAMRREIRSSYQVFMKTHEFLTAKQVAIYEDAIPLLGLEEELREFYAGSKAFRAGEEEMALRKAQEDTERERRLRHKAEKNEQRARQRTRLAASISLLALALALFAGWNYLQADQARRQAGLATEAASRSAREAEARRGEALARQHEAEEARRKANLNAGIALQKSEEARRASLRAEQNLKRAKAEEALARLALEQVGKEKTATEEQRKRAEDNARLAQKAASHAEAERDKARITLEKLETANSDVVRLILQNAQKDILKLEYGAALEKINAAATLGALRESVARAYLELAFWYGEAGKTRLAVALLDSAAQLSVTTVRPEGSPAQEDSPIGARRKIRELIRQFDENAYLALWERYYPVMARVEGGRFSMGAEEKGGSRDEKIHPALASSFYMAKLETTWWQFALFCEATGRNWEAPGWSADGDNPVVNVNWYDALEYCNWVSGQMGYDAAITRNDDGNFSVNLRANGFRLPTEAEWEYAAKGGPYQALYIFAGSNDVNEVAWHWSNSGGRTHPVGRKKPNALGLYDMSGNVFEWCLDWYGRYPKNPPPDYAGPAQGTGKIVRGGTWYFLPSLARCADRASESPDFRGFIVGIRLVRGGE